MALTGDTGNGATLTLAIYDGTTAITAALEITDVDLAAITVDSVDTSTLGTTGHAESIPGDLAQSGDNTANFKWLTKAKCPTLPSPAGVFTLTYPLRSGETTAATRAGTGYLTSIKDPRMANGELQVGSLAWRWDGDTGPTYTPAV
jgi:hypothetical protein